ncbi:MAG: hypothetical protein V4722_23675 [Bacteroidota bacterium]
MKSPTTAGPGKTLVFALMILLLQSCYHYRVLTTESDPATEYQQKVLWSYCWGLINKPKDFIVPNCDNKNALDEVRVTTSLGGSILTIVTLGIVAPVKVQWRCHKPPQRIGDL